MSKKSWKRKIAAGLTVAGAFFGVSPDASSAEVALFFNPTYVDAVANDCNAEATNLLLSLQSFGDNVATFTGITATDFQTIVEGRNALLLPEFNDQFNTDLDVDAENAIADYVDQGGRLIVFGEDDTALQTFLTDVFGFSITVASSPDESTKTAEAAGTIFADGPTTIPDNDGTAYLLDSSLPTGSVNVYNFNDGSDDQAVVAIIPFGTGEIIFLGWDWYSSEPGSGDNAACEGPQDGGWQSLLSTAVAAGAPVPTPTPTPVPTAIPTPSPTPNPPIQLGGGGCSLQANLTMDE